MISIYISFTMSVQILLDLNGSMNYTSRKHGYTILILLNPTFIC